MVIYAIYVRSGSVLCVVYIGVCVTQTTTLLLLGYVLCDVTCLYIKDDGERCQRDTEPFCHQHSDSRMALMYHTLKDEQNSLDSGYECGDCDATVEVVVSSIERSPVRFRQFDVSYGLACECTTYEKEHGDVPSRIADTEIPDGWE